MNSIVNIIFILVVLCFQLITKVQLKIVNIGNLNLSSGKLIDECTIAYRTFGSVNSNSSDIIIIPHGLAELLKKLEN
jgi:homoserine acetyltransferase